jgi:hypothetical protein
MGINKGGSMNDWEDNKINNTTGGSMKLQSKLKKAEEEIIKILIKDKPKDSNISEEQIKILANTILKNYLTKKEIN